MAITNATIIQCKTKGIVFFAGYKNAAPKRAESGTAHKIQYSKVWVALINGTKTATIK